MARQPIRSTHARGPIRQGRRSQAPTRRPAAREESCGFSISVYDQRLIEDNARERFGVDYGDDEARAEATKAGFLDVSGDISRTGWDQLNDDIDKIERNSMKWLRSTFISARDDGHDSRDDLVGSVWFDPTNYEHARLIELAYDGPGFGRNERIDMSDASYGDLADSAMNGVSDFGAQVLGGQIIFFNASDEAKQDMEAVLDRESRAHRARSGH